MTSKMTSTSAANALVTFINASPTAWHAVHNASALLEKAGFKRVEEGSNWEKDLEGGSKVFYTRNQSTLLAFTVPKAGFKPGTGVSAPTCAFAHGNLADFEIDQVGVETYGGGIWHSWFDRDLSLAGRVVVANQSSASTKDSRTIDSHKFTSKLVKINRPILRIPTLAIHLDRGVNDNFKFNNETEFIPILGQISAQLNGKRAKQVEKMGDSSDDDDKLQTGGSVVANNHHLGLLDLLAEELGVGVDAIQDFELATYDTQPSCLGGLNNEFIFSPRLDNLMSTFSAVEAIIRSSSQSSLQELEGNINAIICFNHEEVGSVSSTGAESSMLPNFLSRLSPTPSEHATTISRSFLISADVGHAVHPNYTAKHEENHRPVMNGGIALKTNAKQKYTTDAWGSFLIRKLVERKGGNVQEFSSRNDMPCGSTVGPMLSKIGVRTVDVGMTILSMHSCRETGGAHDVQSYIDLFQAFFEGFATLDKDLQVI
ncbi:hypothetical protein FRB97_000961 [Tulasnella sp. 331]|nr:hypothetical protein FRB97_000961 [Tulasnella sp. 331]